MAQEIKRISDLIPSIAAGTKVDLDELVDQEIVIHNVVFRQGQFGEYAVVEFENEKFSDTFFTTGAQVIVKKLKEIQPHLPVIARVVKRRGNNKRYYYDLE